MKLLKNSLTIRGDSLYCPLSLSLDTYGNCLFDCHHCYLRNLNEIWGKDLKPIDIELFKKKLHNGLKNKNPKTPLAHCLANKKTIRWGNKTDPFQPAELKYKRAPEIFSELIQLKWSFVIQTMNTDVMMEYAVFLACAHSLGLITIMPIVSPGLDKDWEIFEKKATTSPKKRLHHLRMLSKEGMPVGVNGEPFIPGFHTIKDFEDTLKLLKSYGIKSYNTYNLHLNPFVAKRLSAIGLDIRKIWEMNQDGPWKRILGKLMELSKKHNIHLGCPDFVNTGHKWLEKANTCCGINVPNPTMYNTHHWKKLRQEGFNWKEIFDVTWDGSGDKEEGLKIMKSKSSKFYSLQDAGIS